MGPEIVQETYTIRSGSFEGPLDVLLELIEARKFFINELSLAEVTADYIVYVRNLPKLDFEYVTGFLSVISTLILIKSRSLLPNLTLTQEEEEKIIDLESRLKLYSAVKDASQYVKDTFGKKLVFFAPERVSELSVFSPDPKLTLLTMQTMLLGVLEHLPQKEILPEVSVRRVMSLDEMIEGIVLRVQDAMKISFHDLARHPHPEDQKAEKIYTIVSFLAMLELIREGIVNVLQDGLFSEITLEKNLIPKNEEAI